MSWLLMIWRFHEWARLSAGGVTIYWFFDELYYECQPYTNRIIGAGIDTYNTCSNGRNHTEIHSGTGFEYKYMETTVQ